MIRDFKRRFQKPTGDRLDEIEIHVRSATDPQWSLPTAVPCRAGEWFVELICLIPIHIAVARDNRFLPLQDGVSSDDLTLKLLGSEVGEIINAITIGPYEAILGSYMATKPVKVVSSMGEFPNPLRNKLLWLIGPQHRNTTHPGEQSVGVS